MCNAHPFFPLKILGKKVCTIDGKIGYILGATMQPPTTSNDYGLCLLPTKQSVRYDLFGKLLSPTRIDTPRGPSNGGRVSHSFRVLPQHTLLIIYDPR